VSFAADLMESLAPFSGYRFLVVEDEVMQAAHVSEMLAELGGTVSKAVYNYPEARQAIDDVAFDCAILDINLGGTLAFPLVDVLRDRGIPLVICTSYADAVDVHRGSWGAPRLDKPVRLEALREVVLEALSVVVPGAE
jgi:CheY-like chemotaxis protein